MSLDLIKGGLSSGLPDSVFSRAQINKGIKVELEHTKNRTMAKEIAKDHLVENPKYYDYLDQMEVRMKKNKSHIHGYWAKVGNKTLSAFSFAYFLTKKQAKTWAKGKIVHHKSLNIKQWYRIEPKVFTTCHCGKYMDIREIECLRCEKLRDDARGSW